MSAWQGIMCILIANCIVLAPMVGGGGTVSNLRAFFGLLHLVAVVESAGCNLLRPIAPCHDLHTLYFPIGKTVCYMHVPMMRSLSL